jgi:hypothetical protein
MNLEELFSEQMINLKNRIETIGSKYPNLIKAFSLKKNDPHVEKMISSFALITASLEYEVAKKMAKEIRSVFLNVYPEEFTTVPPAGMVIIKPNHGQYFKIEKDRNLRDNIAIFKTTRDIYVGDVTVAQINKTFHHNIMCLHVTLEGNQLETLKILDLYIDINTLNSIFLSEKSVIGTLKNREQYETEFDISIHDSFNIRDFCLHQSHFSFVRISNLKIQNNPEGKLELFIPLKRNVEIDNSIVQTNLIPVSNRFMTHSAPFDLVQQTECLIPEDLNQEIINIKAIKKLNGDVIEHINQDNNGWHLLVGKHGFEIYVESEINEPVIAEIECFNTHFDPENIVFEEYIPGATRWHEVPSDAFRHIYQNDINKLIQLMYIDNKSLDTALKSISELLVIYNAMLKINFNNIETVESIKPVKLVNYVVPKICHTISCSTNTNNFLLLRHIVEEIRRRINTKIDFIFNTSEGEMYYE